MTSKLILLSIIAAAATAASLAPSAHAQEKRGARFSFAPNYFKTEQPRVPNDYAAPSVKAGAVPRSSNFLLGGDPEVLRRPPAPPATHVAAVPAAPQVTGRAFVPNTNFHPSFGQPIQALQAGVPLPMAQSAPQAAAPVRAAAPQAKAPVHKVAKSAPSRHHVARAVTGKLKTPIHPTGQAASPATYGNIGYIPGGHLPARSGYGTSVKTDVHGVIKSSH